MAKAKPAKPKSLDAKIIELDAELTRIEDEAASERAALGFRPTKKPTRTAIKRFKAAKTSLLDDVIWNNSPVTAARLLDEGADPNGRSNRGDREPFLVLAVSRVPTLVQPLLDHGADPNVFDKKNRNCELPLHIALRGRYELIEPLLAAGADPNLTSSLDGKPQSTAKALHRLASHKQGLKLLTLLLEHGLDANAEVGGESLFGAVLAQGPESWIDVLLRHGANVNFVDKQRRASFEMIGPWIGDRMARLLGKLLDHGLDPNLRFRYEPLLVTAINTNDAKLIERVLAAGADPRVRYAKAPAGDHLASRLYHFKPAVARKLTKLIEQR